MTLTPQAEREILGLANRYHVSPDAVRTLLAAVQAGNGTMAQFQHSELGGSGQWLRGGMTMVGDMFNDDLRAKVANLCSDIAQLLQSGAVARAETKEASREPRARRDWWPAELGVPGSSGGQNDVRYAYFPEPRRLAIEQHGKVELYDTLDHRISGVQQQQGGQSGRLAFTSQRGTFTVDSLPPVKTSGAAEW